MENPTPRIPWKRVDVCTYFGKNAPSFVFLRRLLALGRFADLHAQSHNALHTSGEFVYSSAVFVVFIGLLLRKALVHLQHVRTVSHG